MGKCVGAMAMGSFAYFTEQVFMVHGELPDLKSPGLWSQKYKDKLGKSVIEMNNYTDVVLKLNDILNSTRRNNYYWNLSLALYNFQTATPRLLLALKQSDSRDKTQHEKGIEQIQQAMTEFHRSW